MIETVGLDDLVETIKIIYYGDAGVGKTTALATLSEFGKIFVINAEGGFKKRALEQMGIDTNNIEIWNKPVAWENIKELMMDLMDFDGEYVGVVVDSMTEIYSQLLAEVVDDAVVRAFRAGTERDVSKVYLDDYGVAVERTTRFARILRDLPCHVGISCLARKDVNEDKGFMEVSIDVSPALQRRLTGMVDIICHVEQETYGSDVVVLGSFSKKGIILAKDRFGVMPPRIATPSFARVIEYIEGSLTRDDDEETDRVQKIRKENK